MARECNAPMDVIVLLETAAEEWTKQALDDGWGFEDLR